MDNFEEYYRCNDDDFRDKGTTYLTQSLSKALTLQERLELTEYKIKVITSYVEAVTTEIDNLILSEYEWLTEIRVQLSLCIKHKCTHSSFDLEHSEAWKTFWELNEQ